MLSAMTFLCAAITSYAQDSIVEKINSYGKFDRWTVREIEESGIIGGQTKYLYEFYGSPSDTLRSGKTPFQAPEGYLWRRQTIPCIRKGAVTVIVPV